MLTRSSHVLVTILVNMEEFWLNVKFLAEALADEQSPGPSHRTCQGSGQPLLRHANQSGDIIFTLFVPTALSSGTGSSNARNLRIGLARLVLEFPTNPACHGCQHYQQNIHGQHHLHNLTWTAQVYIRDPFELKVSVCKVCQTEICHKLTCEDMN